MLLNLFISNYIIVYNLKTMKKLLIVFLISIMSIGCKKEEELTPNNPPPQCKCGVITDDGINSQTNCYWLEIQSDCSGNKKSFCFSQNVWMSSYVGTRFCVTNEPGW